MAQTKEYTVFSFDELSDTAKDRARIGRADTVCGGIRPMSMLFNRGDFVEFTDVFVRDYPSPRVPARFGVCVESTNDAHAVRVMLADRSTVSARFIHASGWVGWAPDELETLQAELFPESHENNDEWDGF